MRYVDRADAGRRIAPAVAAAIDDRVREGEDPIVLGVPRGGAIVAVEVARSLSAPLDLALARKIGAPENPELAIGAIGESGPPVLDRQLIKRLSVTEDYVAAATERARRELVRQVEKYRGADQPKPVIGRIAIVVDDGIATGATLRATIQTVRGRAPAFLVCAVPVGPPDSVRSIAAEVDAVVCPMQPRWFRAVGEWYESFSQTTDAEVVAAIGGSGS